jgi:hypothetical protein
MGEIQVVWTQNWNLTLFYIKKIVSKIYYILFICIYILHDDLHCFLFIFRMMTFIADCIAGISSVHTTSYHSNTDSDTNSRAHKMVLTPLRNFQELSTFTLQFAKSLTCSLRWDQYCLTETSAIFRSHILMSCFSKLVSNKTTVFPTVAPWNRKETTCIAKNRVHIRVSVIL